MKQISTVNISWKPDKTSSVPVYRQIVRFVSDKVASGEWPVGTRLPSQRAMAELFGVNRSTVSNATDELTSYGIIGGSRGAGTHIISNTWSTMLSSSPDWSSFVSSGAFKENSSIIQAINRLEFEPGIIRLGTGEPDPRLFPAEMWGSVMQKLGSSVAELGYAGPLGLPELRDAISQHMKSLGVDVPPSCILITSGALQALQLISVCLLRPGSVIFTEAPTYLKSLQVFQSAGMELSGIPMDESGLQYWKIASQLENEKLRGASALYTIPTNHNPTGITMPESRRRELMDFCEENRLPVIEDCAYHELCYGAEPPAALKSMDRTGSVIYLGTASKTLAPGLRIGWVAAPEPIVQRMGDVKMQMDYGASSISQLIFAEFLSSGMYSRHLRELKRQLQQRRDNALDVLERYFSEIAEWRHPDGGFYIWLTFRGKISTEKLFERAAAAGILLNPGSIYDFESNRSLRLSYAYASCEEFAYAAEKLAGIVKDMAGKVAGSAAER